MPVCGVVHTATVDVLNELAHADVDDGLVSVLVEQHFPHFTLRHDDIRPNVPVLVTLAVLKEELAHARVVLDVAVLSLTVELALHVELLSYAEHDAVGDTTETEAMLQTLIEAFLLLRLLLRVLRGIGQVFSIGRTQTIDDAHRLQGFLVGHVEEAAGHPERDVDESCTPFLYLREHVRVLSLRAQWRVGLMRHIRRGVVYHSVVFHRSKRFFRKVLYMSASGSMES